jgi:GNAT superfamily N-acetyltransferase
MRNVESTSAVAKQLAHALPDTAGWIDTRGMLLSGRATIIGGDTVGAGFVVRAMSDALAVVSVVGYPAHHLIATAVEDATDMTPVIAQPDNAVHVGQALASCPRSSAGHRWAPERAVLHRLGSESASVLADDVHVRLLRGDDRLDHLPPGLRFEIGHAHQTTPVAAAMADARPVSFCYPCWMTETLWDVSIDTLEGYRRRGLAARAARFMIALMRAEGREPVWGAMESNVASMELARRLGFAPAGEIVVFSRGPWAYLTRGHQPESA